MSNDFQTSVQSLMSILRDSIESLVPHLMKAQLIDENLEGYDGWDLIVEALFKSIVEDSIRWSLPEKSMDQFSLPKYGFDPESIKDKSYIQVRTTLASDVDQTFCFIEFTSSPKFSGIPKLVTVREINDQGLLGDFRVPSFESSSFSCSYFENGKRSELGEIAVNN